MSSASSSALEEHREIIRALSKSGGPLDPKGPQATLSNPEWFGWVDQQLITFPDRADLHTRLMFDYRAAEGGGEEDFQAIVLAGPPGAGKSSVKDAVLGKEQGKYLVIDPDEFKRALLRQAIEDGSYESFLKPAEVRGHNERFFPLELASLVHEESSLIAYNLRKEAIAAGENLVIDTVLSSVDKALMLGQELENAGYTVRLFDVEADYETCRERIIRRWQQARAAALKGTDELGGRWVPTEVSEEVFSGPDGKSRSMEASERLAGECAVITEFHRFWVVDPDAAPKLTDTWCRSGVGQPLEPKEDEPVEGMP